MPNRVAVTYTYDGLDRLTRLKDSKGNTVVADNNYQYNTAGDIIRASARVARTATAKTPLT
ncbi:MAG: hypothetical protein H0U18_08985, partial [Pyrinomonadaceae bacterium]|nr:hypothetical protein [Pyrinomonadaceae bacterium]